MVLEPLRLYKILHQEVKSAVRDENIGFKPVTEVAGFVATAFRLR